MTLRAHGFTLIELLIAVTIFVFLIMLAGPMYTEFMANHQIRNATDAMLNGVQEAQSAAVRNNTLARLLVDTTTGTGGWKVFQTVDGTEKPAALATCAPGRPASDTPSLTTSWRATRRSLLPGAGRCGLPRLLRARRQALAISARSSASCV